MVGVASLSAFWAEAARHTTAVPPSDQRVLYVRVVSYREAALAEREKSLSEQVMRAFKM